MLTLDPESNHLAPAFGGIEGPASIPEKPGLNSQLDWSSGCEWIEYEIIRDEFGYLWNSKVVGLGWCLSS